jgi:hypothetical protein
MSSSRVRESHSLSISSLLATVTISVSIFRRTEPNLEAHLYSRIGPLDIFKYFQADTAKHRNSSRETGVVMIVIVNTDLTGT